MAQVVFENPHMAVEEELSQMFADQTISTAVSKAIDDFSATKAAKVNDDDLSTEKKINHDLATAKVNAVSDNLEKKNRIQVSNTKKPLFFYLNLAKRYIKQYNNVELSALGMAIPTVVTIAEILKANGVAVEKKVLTSTVGSKDENKGRLVQKAKIEIVLEKNQAAKEAEESEGQAEADKKESTA